MLLMKGEVKQENDFGGEIMLINARRCRQNNKRYNFFLRACTGNFNIARFEIANLLTFVSTSVQRLMEKQHKSQASPGPPFLT